MNYLLRIGLILVMSMLIGCTATSSKIDNSMVQNIESILVVAAVYETSESLAQVQREELYVGASFINSVLKEELQGDPRIEFTDNNIDLPSLPIVNGGVYKTALTLGQTSGVDAILIPSISRFRQRVGTNMSVETPAAATFKLRLISIESGQVLWVGSFDETQQSLMGNLFSIGKVVNRGLKWITVEDMVKTGLRNKINECPYL